MPTVVTSSAGPLFAVLVHRSDRTVATSQTVPRTSPAQRLSTSVRGQGKCRLVKK